VAVVDLAFLERLAQERQFEPQTLEIAKRLMIYGHTAKHLALEYGLNISRIYAIRNLVQQAADSLPDGWIRVTVEGPQHLVERLQKQLADAIARERES
jgi:hypothetical protein